MEQLAEVKRVVLDAATDTVVLNADDSYCLRMAKHTNARRISYFTTNPANAFVRDHILAGGQAVVLERGINGETITLYDNGAHSPLMWTHEIPATLSGNARFNVHNAMFAAAVAYNMGKSFDDIRLGLSTFDSSFFQAPGRMNFFKEHPFDVILDYAHNSHGMNAFCKVVDRLDVAGLRHIVIASPGNRRDEDIQEYAREAAGHFDHFICRSDDNRRGRGDEEVPQIMRTALIEEGVPEDAIKIIVNETDAVNFALHSALQDDLVVVIAGDDVTRCWNQIIRFSHGSSIARKTWDKPMRLVQKRIENIITTVPSNARQTEGSAYSEQEREVGIEAEAEEGD